MIVSCVHVKNESTIITIFSIIIFFVVQIYKKNVFYNLLDNTIYCYVDGNNIISTGIRDECFVNVCYKAILLYK